MTEPLPDIAFIAPIVEWRGPAPFFFADVPDEHVGAIREAAREASYGWGCVPVEASVNGVAFTTSLFPKGGGYRVPLKIAVRRRTGVALGDTVTVALRVPSGERPDLRPVRNGIDWATCPIRSPRTR